MTEQSSYVLCILLCYFIENQHICCFDCIFLQKNNCYLFFSQKTFVDNYWDKNAVTNLSDKDTKYSVKGLVYTLKPKTMTDIIKNPGKELK